MPTAEEYMPILRAVNKMRDHDTEECVCSCDRCEEGGAAVMELLKAARAERDREWCEAFGISGRVVGPGDAKAALGMLNEMRDKAARRAALTEAAEEFAAMHRDIGSMRAADRLRALAKEQE